MNKKRSFFNDIVYWLSRPWFLTITIAFILIPITKVSQALESGAEFLRIDTDARAVSMGSAYTAAASGVNAITYNPAGLSYLKGVELGFSHTKWLLDSRHDFIGMAIPVSGLGSGDSGFVEGSGLARDTKPESQTPIIIGLGITRLTSGSMQTRGADRSVSNSFEAYDQSISLAAAKRINRNTRIGASVKYIQSAIAGESANAVAFDFGISRKMKNMPMSLALAVRNLGTPMKYIDQKDPLPLSITGGMLLSIIPGVNMALDVQRMIYDKQTTVSIGTEYTAFSGFSLRSGYMMESGLVNANGKG
ncbi:MAG: hypothetical protein KAI33_05820, partial [Elusimicrobiales bacterium]|nr:hypothetical protein [Elusimicrobiales bacterium]